jgi:amino acid permease
MNTMDDPEKYDSKSDELTQPASMEEGEHKFHKLGWKRLTICLIVEAIALGSLSLPSVFATLGMVPGILITVTIGLLAMYTSYIIGNVKLKYPHIKDYAEALGLIWGNFGYQLAGVMFFGLLILLVGSHVLTGTIAFIKIVDKPEMCALIWGVVSAILLFFLALPPTFAKFAILGYIDFASILLAIGITIIATGIESTNAPGGLNAVNWRLWPKEDLSFASAFLSVTNILFAYSFGMVQFSFMDEMHTPTDYIKSTCAIGVIESK